MEKIAYIITTYKDPAHLKRLIIALNFYSDFYIHIDKKVDFEPFRKELSSLQRDVYYISKYKVTWGGYSQVLTYKKMLGQSYIQDKNISESFVSGARLSRLFK